MEDLMTDKEFKRLCLLYFESHRLDGKSPYNELGCINTDLDCNRCLFGSSDGIYFYCLFDKNPYEKIVKARKTIDKENDIIERVSKWYTKELEKKYLATFAENEGLKERIKAVIECKGELDKYNTELTADNNSIIKFRKKTPVDD